MKKSIREYVRKQCILNNNGKECWSTIKPLISSKSKSNSDSITLKENGSIINDPVSIGNVLNQYYVNITKEIGQQDAIGECETIQTVLNKHSAHESVMRIKNSIANQTSFSFTLVDENEVCKKLKTLNGKKATGFDKLPPKLIKLGAETLCRPIGSLINMSIKQSVFPSMLKYAEVTPIFKKSDMLDKKNYRPVSVLPCFSKIFEGILIDQMNVFFEKLLSQHMSGFRKGYSCQSVLIRFLESCKGSLDNGNVCGTLLTDLSKAFD